MVQNPMTRPPYAALLGYCRVNNWATRMVGGQKKRYDYPRRQFVNVSEDILGFCAEALDLLDIPWRRSRWNCVSVSTRAGLARPTS